jgi:hypothetical protein
MMAISSRMKGTYNVDGAVVNGGGGGGSPKEWMKSDVACTSGDSVGTWDGLLGYLSSL